MENMTNIPSATAESFWAALQALTEKQAETDRQMKETDRQRQENERFLTEKQAETDRILRESRIETDRILTEKFAELAKSQAETDRQRQENERFLTEKQAETDRLIKDLAKQVGGVSSSNGLFAEDYFFNSFEKGQTNFFGEKFDEISKNLKNKRNGLTDEYDIVMFNHGSVAIIEAKYKAHENDVPAMLNKVNTFRILFPDYKDFKIYLGLASMSFYSELEDECKKQGIAIIKQVGDKIVICDENLKAF
jgi:hypothetical protein